MSIIDNFINNLIYQYEVLSNAFLVEDSTVISEHFHHPIENVHHERWRDVVFSSRHEVNSELLSVEEIYTLYILNNHSQTNRKLTKAGGGSPCQNFTFLKNISLVSLPKSSLTTLMLCFIANRTISCNNSISSCWKNKELWQHLYFLILNCKIINL